MDVVRVQISGGWSLGAKGFLKVGRPPKVCVSIDIFSLFFFFFPIFVGVGQVKGGGCGKIPKLKRTNSTP